MTTKIKLVAAITILLFIAVSATFLITSGRSRTIASGCFHQVAHKTSGCVALIELDNGNLILQFDDFNTAESPALHVLLISAADAFENETVKRSDQLYIGPLLSSSGSQRYVVPPGRDPADLNAVTIWNSKYEVNFGTAPLKRTQTPQ
jgi:hypothetical protein